MLDFQIQQIEWRIPTRPRPASAADFDMSVCHEPWQDDRVQARMEQAVDATKREAL